MANPTDALEAAFIALCDPDIADADADAPRERLIRGVADLVQHDDDDDDHARIFTAAAALIEPHTDQGPYQRRTMRHVHAAIVDLVLTLKDAERDLCAAPGDDPSVISMRTMARMRIALQRIEQARRDVERAALSRPAYR